VSITYLVILESSLIRMSLNMTTLSANYLTVVGTTLFSLSRD